MPIDFNGSIAFCIRSLHEKLEDVFGIELTELELLNRYNEELNRAPQISTNTIVIRVEYGENIGIMSPNVLKLKGAMSYTVHISGPITEDDLDDAIETYNASLCM